MKKPYSTPRLNKIGTLEQLKQIPIVKLAIEYRQALLDLLSFWDRRNESGWTAADVRRLAEIRRKAAA